MEKHLCRQGLEVYTYGIENYPATDPGIFVEHMLFQETGYNYSIRFYIGCPLLVLK